jgi:virginiamycin A acetyltransferase
MKIEEYLKNSITRAINNWIRNLIVKFKNPTIKYHSKNIIVKSTFGEYVTLNDEVSVIDCCFGDYVNLQMRSSVVNCNIGSFTYIAENGKLSLSTVGKFCSIGPNLLCGWGIHPLKGISTSPVFYSTTTPTGFSLSSIDKIQERLPIIIGNDVFIGANVTILDGVTIGNGAVIGAGAVVSKNIPPYAIAIGVPITIISYRFSEENIEKLEKIEWWNFNNDRLREVEKMFFEPDKFINRFFNI